MFGAVSNVMPIAGVATNALAPNASPANHRGQWGQPPPLMFAYFFLRIMILLVDIQLHGMCVSLPDMTFASYQPNTLRFLMQTEYFFCWLIQQPSLSVKNAWAGLRKPWSVQQLRGMASTIPQTRDADLCRRRLWQFPINIGLSHDDWISGQDRNGGSID